MTEMTAISAPLRQKPKMSAARIEGMISFITGLMITAVLIYGWINRGDSSSIDPDHGVGYWLGIVGGSMMLILLIYPLRKRVRFLNPTGSVGFWFRFHMLLGLLGPVAILYHARFSWGALNSGVALGSMLIVAGSGLIGRFFYSRIHRSYSGRKIEVRSYLTEMHELLELLQVSGLDAKLVQSRLIPFEKGAVAAGVGFWSSAKSVFTIGWRSRLEQRSLRKEIMATALPSGLLPVDEKELRRGLVQQSSAFFDAVRRAAEYAFYDRLFRLWHLLHLPLFFLLVGTAILHIVAVHMY